MFVDWYDGLYNFLMKSTATTCGSLRFSYDELLSIELSTTDGYKKHRTTELVSRTF